MHIEERAVGDVMVLDLKGRVTLGEGDELLKDKVNSLINQGQKKLVLNLAEVPYIDSAGLGESVSVVSHDFTDEHRTLLGSGSFAYVLHQDIHYCVLAAARVLRALCESVRGALNVVQPRVEILTAENLH